MQHFERGIARQPFFEQAGCRRGHVSGSIRELGRQSRRVQRPRVEGVGDQVAVRQQILGNGERRLLAVGDQAECGVRGSARQRVSSRSPASIAGSSPPIATSSSRDAGLSPMFCTSSCCSSVRGAGMNRRRSADTVSRGLDPGEAQRQQATPARPAAAQPRRVIAARAGRCRGRRQRRSSSAREGMRAAGAARVESASKVSAPSPSGSSASTQPGRSPLPYTSMRSRCFARRESRGLRVSFQFAALLFQCHFEILLRAAPGGLRAARGSCPATRAAAARAAARWCASACRRA